MRLQLLMIPPWAQSDIDCPSAPDNSMCRQPYVQMQLHARLATQATRTLSSR